MDERRRLQRSRVYLGGVIAFQDRRRTLDCLVRNLTDEGAMIESPNIAGVPDRFSLDLPQKGLSFEARSVWRQPERMGVGFAPKAQATSHDPSAVPALAAAPAAPTAPIPLALARRLKTCEAEREALKRRVAELSEPG